MTAHTDYKNKKWLKKRDEILKRDNYTCQMCFKQKRVMQVHHLRYIFGKKLWDYPDDWLVTLCEGCHRKETEDTRNLFARIYDMLLAGMWAKDIMNKMDIKF